MKKYIPFCLLALAAVFWAVPALRSTYVETDTSSFYNADLMFRDSMNDITFSDNGEGRLNQKGEELDEGTFLEAYKELHDARCVILFAQQSDGGDPFRAPLLLQLSRRCGTGLRPGSRETIFGLFP